MNEETKEHQNPEKPSLGKKLGIAALTEFVKVGIKQSKVLFTLLASLFAGSMTYTGVDLMNGDSAPSVETITEMVPVPQEVRVEVPYEVKVPVPTVSEEMLLNITLLQEEINRLRDDVRKIAKGCIVEDHASLHR